MTRLVMLRHGQTAWSRAGRLQGRTDTELDAQCADTFSVLRVPATLGLMRVLTSPLRRCTQTATHLRLFDAVVEPRIVEMSWGAWEGRVLRTLRKELGSAMAANEARGMDFTPDGGESPRQVLERVRPWLAEIGGAQLPTLAITHRGVIRVLLALATGWDMTGKPPAKLDWTALQVFRVDQGGQVQVEQLNLALEPADGASVNVGRAQRADSA
ncbi:MAG: histidine phosphatase family protein [Rhodoferax sp.]|nr:histidine phosphatase family protein [Rhodoferax sp.]